jgi:hypothetical protein
MASPPLLTSLSPREAVTDCIFRFVHGLDTNDRSLVESASLKSESMTLVIGDYTMEGWKAISDFIEKVYSVVTTHVISNIRVDVKDGADTAVLYAHAMAYHVRPEDALKVEDTSYTVSNLYRIDLVKGEDGLWKTKRWEIKPLWTKGDKAIMGQ